MREMTCATPFVCTCSWLLIIPIVVKSLLWWRIVSSHWSICHCDTCFVISCCVHLCNWRAAVSLWFVRCTLFWCWCIWNGACNINRVGYFLYLWLAVLPNDLRVLMPGEFVLWADICSEREFCFLACVIIVPVRPYWPRHLAAWASRT